MDSEINPLNGKHLKQMQDDLKRLDAAEALARRAQAGGMDMTSEFERINRERARTLQMKQAFFPDS